MKTISLSQWVAAVANTARGVHAASTTKFSAAVKPMRIPLAMRELKRPEGRAPMGLETWRLAISFPWLASVIILFGVFIASAQVNLTIGNLAPGGSVTLTFDVTVTNPFPANLNAVTNQGTLSGNNFNTLSSDDPQTSAVGDATVTIIEVPPTVTSQAATGITPTSATLNSLVNPNGLATAAFFQFGLTTGYGDLSTTTNFGGGTTPLASAATLTNLAPGTLYHYRIVATNTAGTNAGGDLFFTTVAIPPPLLTGLAKTNGGPFQFTFTNTTGQTFTVVATTNLSVPFSNWTVLGTATEGPAGQFKFSDAQATNSTSKFYRVRWP